MRKIWFVPLCALFFFAPIGVCEEYVSLGKLKWQEEVYCTVAEGREPQPGFLRSGVWTSFEAEISKRLREKNGARRRVLRKRWRKELRRFERLCKEAASVVNPTPTPTPIPDPGVGCAVTAQSMAVQAAVGETISFSLSGTDSCGRTLTATVLEEPVHGTLSGSGQVKNYVAGNYPGSYAVPFTVSNGEFDSTSASVTISVHGASRDVAVVDHAFSPKDITVNEDDTVTWRWHADYHDVTPGTDPNFTVPYSGAFGTGIENTGHIYSVQFTRNLLRTFPAPSNRYDYYCTPHVLMGMTGSILVLPREKAFVARLTGMEAVPESPNLSAIRCSLILSADGSELAINCLGNSSVPITASFLRRGDIGKNGESICSLGSAIPSGVLCPMTEDRVSYLFGGELYIEIESPGGVLRGQVVDAGGAQRISGKVVTGDGRGLSGVLVTDGLRTAKTDDLGRYTLPGVSNGVYWLSATREGYSVVPKQNVSPALVNGYHLSLRDFLATSE